MSDSTAEILVISMVAGVVTLVIWLAFVPGIVARRRKHPSAQAISICGVLGLLIWPLWLVAYIWAYTGPDLSKEAANPKKTAGGLACDGCGQPLDIARARQVGPRLICPACAAALDGAAPYAPQAEQLIDPAEDLRRLAARPRKGKQGEQERTP